MSAIISFDTPNRLRRPGFIAGVAVSLLLHAVLLFGYRLSSPPRAEQPARAMTVWLQPPKPLVKVEPPPQPKREKREVATAAPAPARAPAEPEAAAVAATALPDRPAESQAITLPREQDPLYADQQPKQFTLEEARKAARRVAKEKDPAKAGTLTAQLEDHPLYAEPSTNELAKKMEGAKKTDCLKSASGAGLLAPLFWAMDKHCKF